MLFENVSSSFKVVSNKAGRKTSTETSLTPYSISSGSNMFGVTALLSDLDGPIFTQPLVAPNQQITCPVSQTIVACTQGLSGVYEVVYVTTNENTIYAIDAASGQIILKRNLGLKTEDCGGTLSTPVIDGATKRLYVLSQTITDPTPGSTAPHRVLFML